MASPPPVGPDVCSECGTELAPALLSCPRCHRLRHAETLAALAGEAEQAAREGRADGALRAWQKALELLPAGSRQHQAIAGKIAGLTPQVATEAAQRPPWARRAGPLGVLALMAWKFKAIALFVLSKGTLLTMLLSIGVYWTAWGWRFALGLVVGIYVHEIGHVAALQARGVKAEAPMFVPGLGAFVRHVPLNDPAAEARVALAGPLWGLGVALAAVLAFAGTGAGIWAGIAQWTARLNLFNLVPLPPLDGDKAFRGLSSGQRWLFVAATAAVMLPTREGVLWLVLGLGVLRAFSRSEDRPPDWPLFGQAVFTLLALAGLCAIPVPVPPQE